MLQVAPIETCRSGRKRQSRQCNKEGFFRLQVELAAFASLPRLEKRPRLRELSALVAGVRVLRWDLVAGEGGSSSSSAAAAAAAAAAGVEDLPALLGAAAEAAGDAAEAAAQHAADRARRLTALAERLVSPLLGQEKGRTMAEVGGMSKNKVNPSSGLYRRGGDGWRGRDCKVNFQQDFNWQL